MNVNAPRHAGQWFSALIQRAHREVSPEKVDTLARELEKEAAAMGDEDEREEPEASSDRAASAAARRARAAGGSRG